jgi:hypothetical protein
LADGQLHVGRWPLVEASHCSYSGWEHYHSRTCVSFPLVTLRVDQSSRWPWY